MTQNKISAIILLCGILAVTLPYQLSVQADPDLWWHTLTGSIILEKKIIPKTDLFSFTASGQAWINHEWLSDVVFAATWHAAKDKGLLLLRIFLLTGIALCLIIIFMNRWPNEWIALILLAMILPVVNIFINIRPHSFTYLFTLLTICLWDAWITGKKSGIWILPVLMIFWVNLHGGFLLGVTVNSLFIASIFVGLEDPKTQPGFKDKLQLLAVFVLTILATLVTPWGFDLYYYLVKELGSTHSFITEWQGINTSQQVFFIVYLLVPAALYVINRKWNQVAILVLFVISACSAWVHARFIVVMIIFGSIMAIHAARDLFGKFCVSQTWFKYFDRLRQPIYLFIFIGIFMLASLRPYIWSQKPREEFRLRAPVDLIPVHALAFLKEHQLGSNLAIRYNWSGSVIWHLYPQYKVAVDGRNLTVYEGSWVDEYLRSYKSGTLVDYLSDYLVDAILVESKDPMDKALSDNPQWIEGYRDWQAVVYLPNQKKIKHHNSGPTRPSNEILIFPGEV